MLQIGVAGMTESQIDSLGSLAVDLCTQSAVLYVRANNLKVLDYEAATEVLKDYCKTWLPQALNDAKEAFDCGMSQVGEETFKATMRQAGIEAAKEFAFPMSYEPELSK